MCILYCMLVIFCKIYIVWGGKIVMIFGVKFVSMYKIFNVKFLV